MKLRPDHVDVALLILSLVVLSIGCVGELEPGVEVVPHVAGDEPPRLDVLRDGGGTEHHHRARVRFGSEAPSW